MEHIEEGDAQSFGGWVEGRRRALSLTRLELAERVGCAVVTIKKIERDERRPSRQMAELLARHLLIPRVDREAFLRTARGSYGAPAGSLQPLLRIPALLQQDQPRAIPTLGFVERQKELARLQACLNQALAGRATPNFLLGDAGSGKTSLMQEFARLAQDAQPGLLIAGGRCDAQTGQADAFRPVRDILAALTGDFEMNWEVGILGREQALQAWTSIPDVLETIADFGPHLLDTLLPVAPLLRRIRPYLDGDTGWFERFEASADKGAYKHPESEQGQILEELMQVFRALAARHPLLLLLDDLQWVDSASLSFLSQLGRRLGGSHILLVGACRSGGISAEPLHDGQRAGESYTIENLILEFSRQYGDIQIRLDQMSESDGMAFIDAILDQQPNRLGDSFREDLYLHTRGHPLFTTEMLQGMRQNENMVQDGTGYWVENQSAPTYQRPARVEAVIEQRLAHLDPPHRRLLDVASVAGEAFIAEIVAEVLGVDFPQVLQTLTYDLEQRHHLVREQGLLSFRSRQLSRFQFHHMLVQEHVYGALETGEKRRLHRRIAEELERIVLEPENSALSVGKVSGGGRRIIHPEHLDAFGPALLHHLLAGQEWVGAATYASALGARAGQQYAMREAIAYYEQALLALEHGAGADQDLVFDVLLGWEEEAFNFTPYERQQAQLSRAEAIARELNDKPRLIRALHWTANVLLARGLWTQAGPVLAESLALAEELGNEQLSVRPLYFKALMTSFADPSQALKWTALAKDLSRKHADTHMEALSLATEGQVLAELGAFEEAQQALEAARHISGRLGSPLLGSDVDLFSAWALLTMGNWQQALEFGQRSVKMAIETDNMDCICSGMVCIGYINLGLGRIADAASAFQTGIERSEVSGAKIPKQNGQAGLAMTRFMAGDSDAIEELEAIVTEMKSFENRVGAASTSESLGTCLIELGKLDQASNALSEAIEFYRSSQMHPFLGRALQSMAGLMAKRGRNAEAQTYGDEAEAIRASMVNTRA